MRIDHQIILNMIEPNTRVLDLGCGDGDLLLVLEKEKQVQGQGIELDEKHIYNCVENGVSVFHSDIDSGLQGYPDQSFDYVILNQSIQEVKNIGQVIHESLRVGRQIIVGVPNFAYYIARFSLFFRGKAPMTPSLPYDWSDTPNVRFMSLFDFREFCKIRKLRIIKECDINDHRIIRILPNLFALNGIFLIDRS